MLAELQKLDYGVRTVTQVRRRRRPDADRRELRAGLPGMTITKWSW